MKTHRTSPLRAAAFVVAALALPVFASASAPADRAAALLAHRGAVPVETAGPYVERGTFQIQVAAKLGRPDATLPDGTWLFHDREIEGSAARGTLVVRFDGRRVSSLAIVTPAVVAALRAAPANGETKERIAAR